MPKSVAGGGRRPPFGGPGRAQTADVSVEAVLSFVFRMREVNMAMVKSDQPFAGISEMMTQNFEQTRKAMEKYVDLFGTGMKASPWLDADINRKMQSYIEKNMAAANEFIQKLSEAKDVQ